jgi:hypothetical protein
MTTEPPKCGESRPAPPGNGSQNGVQLGCANSGQNTRTIGDRQASCDHRDDVAVTHGRLYRPRRCCECVIEVSPHLRPDGTKCPNGFDARLAGCDEVLCVSDTPLLTAARVLLRAGRADPDDVLVMRHAGSRAVALKGRVGLVASLTIEETRFGPKRRICKPRTSLEGPSRIAQMQPAVPKPPPKGSRSRRRSPSQVGQD